MADTQAEAFDMRSKCWWAAVGYGVVPSISACGDDDAGESIYADRWNEIELSYFPFALIPATNRPNIMSPVHSSPSPNADNDSVVCLSVCSPPGKQFFLAFYTFRAPFER